MLSDDFALPSSVVNLEGPLITQLTEHMIKVREDLHRTIDNVLDAAERQLVNTTNNGTCFDALSSKLRKGKTENSIQTMMECPAAAQLNQNCGGIVGFAKHRQASFESVGEEPDVVGYDIKLPLRTHIDRQFTCRTMTTTGIETTYTSGDYTKEPFKKRKSRLASAIFGGKIVRDRNPSVDHSTVHHREAQAIFADAEDMKEKVRSLCMRKPYNVMDFYHHEGIAQQIARSPYFEYLTLLIILINGVWIAIDLDNNDKELLVESDAIFQVAENFFCIFFTSELLIRFLAFRTKKDALRDSWFCFDLILVIVMVLETWVMSVIILMTGADSESNFGNTSILKLVRLVRLTRMARMAKVLRAIPELIILIRGLLVAARSVFFTLLLLLFMLYIFAIFFVNITKDTNIGDHYYATVPEAMASLLLYSILPDQAGYIKNNSDQNLALGALSLCFVLLASLTVMNMLIGVLCEVVKVVSAVEKEQLTVNFVKHRLLTMLGITGGDIDDDVANKNISRKDFQDLLVKPKAAKIISDLGVDVVNLLEFGEIIYADNDDLPFTGFIELILQMRGTNLSTVKDIVDLRKFLSVELSHFQDQILKATGFATSMSPASMASVKPFNDLTVESPDHLSPKIPHVDAWA